MADWVDSFFDAEEEERTREAWLKLFDDAQLGRYISRSTKMKQFGYDAETSFPERLKRHG